MVRPNRDLERHGGARLGLALALLLTFVAISIGARLWTTAESTAEPSAAVLDLERELNSANTEEEHRAVLDKAKGFAMTEIAHLSNAMAYSELSIARSDSSRSEHQAAIRRLVSALDLLPDLTPGRRSSLLSELGEQWIEFGVLDRARPAIREALKEADADMAERSRVNYGAVYNAYLRRAKMSQADGEYRVGAEQLEEFARSEPFEAIQTRFRQNPGRAEAAQGTIDALLGGLWGEVAREDLEAMDAAVEAFERVLANDGAYDIDQFTSMGKLAALALFTGDTELARERLANLRVELEGDHFGELPSEELAWLAALEARLAELSGIDRESALARLEEAFGRMLDDWRSVKRRGGVSFLYYRRTRLVIDLLIALSDEERALEHVYESQRMGVLWQAMCGERGDLSQARAQLTSKNTGCLVFAPGEDRSWVFAVDEVGIVREAIAGSRVLDESISEFMGELRRSPHSLTSESAKERRRRALEEQGALLAKELLPASILERINAWTHMRVVGSEYLGSLAIEALPIPGGLHLGRSIAVSRLPSLPVGLALDERRPTRKEPLSRLAMLAAPQLAEAFSKLPSFDLDEASLEGVTKHFSEVNLFLGSAATVSALEDPDVARAQVSHLLTHGYQEEADELRPRLLLTPDDDHPKGQLTYEVICGSPVGELVVLSACRSGDGASRFGDSGATHLGGAFLQAGADCVVLSEEELRLKAILAFNEIFYRSVGSGRTVAEALRLTRDELARGSEFADPYHWALVHSYGLDPTL